MIETAVVVERSVENVRDRAVESRCDSTGRLSDRFRCCGTLWMAEEQQNRPLAGMMGLHPQSTAPTTTTTLFLTKIPKEEVGTT